MSIWNCLVEIVDSEHGVALFIVGAHRAVGCAVFAAIRELVKPPKKRPIDFVTLEE